MQITDALFVLEPYVELLNLTTLKLNKTLAFDRSPVQVPDHRAFTRLLTLDLATTPIRDDDLIKLLPTLKPVETLNLTACSQITTTALERCVRGKIVVLRQGMLCIC